LREDDDELLETEAADRRDSLFAVDDFAAAENFAVEDAERVLEVDAVLREVAAGFFMMPFKMRKIEAGYDPV